VQIILCVVLPRFDRWETVTLPDVIEVDDFDHKAAGNCALNYVGATARNRNEYFIHCEALAEADREIISSGARSNVEHLQVGVESLSMAISIHRRRMGRAWNGT
jgi:hypothetical protein